LKRRISPHRSNCGLRIVDCELQEILARARPAPSPAPVCGRPEYRLLLRPSAVALGVSERSARARRRCNSVGARERAASQNCSHRRPGRCVTGVRTGGAILRGTWADGLAAFQPRSSNLRFAQGRPKSYGRSATAGVFPSPRTRRGWADHPRQPVRRSVRAIASTAAFFVSEAIFRSRDRRSTRCCRSILRRP
jgi:hypothetical protein